MAREFGSRPRPEKVNFSADYLSNESFRRTRPWHAICKGRGMSKPLPRASKVMFVALEYGAEWQSRQHPEMGVDAVVVVQLADEDPLLFARRFLTKVVAAVGHGADIVAAVLAVAPIFDVCHLQARCTIARAALRSFRAGSNGKLYLTEPRRAAPECRHHLRAIAEGLMEGAATDSQIRVGDESFSRGATTSRRSGGSAALHGS